MSDADQASQALAELWDIVKCRCHEAYTGRGLHDPDCQCDSTDAVQTVADRIEAMTAKLAKAVEAGVDVAASLNAAISLLERGGKKAAASDKMFAQMLVDYNTSLDRFRATLAEIKGENHD